MFATRKHFSCKGAILCALGCLLLCFALPLGVLVTGRAQPGEGEEPARTLPPPGTRDRAVTLRCLLDGETRRMDLGSYLWGVVAAEMPASFEPEALRAQAVAARTYALCQMGQTHPAHPEADICGDPACCQAWMDRPARLADWGADAGLYARKVSEAIRSTDGLALYYDGAPILAAFHASSAGSTKSALEVWGEDYPYLREVQSPEEAASVPDYYSTVTVKAKRFARKLKKRHPKADLSDPDCAHWFGAVERDAAGLSTAITIGGERVSTVELRSLFRLRSASLSVEGKDGSVTFYVTGYGHGVGMSQYGANALAKQGHTAEEILAWYYPGTQLR